MKFAIATIPARDVKAHREFIVREGNAQDIDKRLRWDLADHVGLTSWFCYEVYPYGVNDKHIDTALRKIMRELFGI
jgi:hypothetical protein